MATPRPPKVVLSERERAELERLVRAFTTGQQLALRARIVLAAGDGLNNLQIARELGVDDETPGHWRGRWLQFREVPLEEVSVAKRLADAPKCGAPAKFTPEQVCQIIALACERPADSNRPISQWSHRELADEIRGTKTPIQAPIRLPIQAITAAPGAGEPGGDNTDVDAYSDASMDMAI